MRDHGLLQTQRTLSWLSKHSEALGSTQSVATAAATASGTGMNGISASAGAPRLGYAGRFISLMQLCQPIAFDLLVEAMQYAHDLRKYVFRLYELRRCGVRTFYGGRVYHRSRAQRLSRVRNKREELYAEQCEWKSLVPAYDGGFLNAATAAAAAASGDDDGTSASMLMHPSAGWMVGGHFLSALAVKRKSTPLEILGLPGYEKLTEAERELCSTVRLVPLSYLGYKQILMAENSKSGYLRLADARRLIKIDVNKTRQLYDFLLKQGFINKLFN